MAPQHTGPQADRAALTEAAEAGIRALIELLGDDPEREGLLDTPARVVRAYEEMAQGIGQEAGDVLSRVFDGDGYDEIVLLRGIEFTSLCEHHLLPFTGTAAVGYIPSDGRVVGLSKLARVVDVFAKRLQMQERLTEQIAKAVQEALAPVGVGVVIRARHSCMGCRGVKRPGAEMVTSVMRGLFREDPRARQELMALIGSPHDGR